jgi:hypothetical protein
VPHLPAGERPHLGREVAVGLAVFGVYAAVASLGGHARRAAAADHSRDLFRLEQAGHLDIERRLNGWLAGHDRLSTLANYEYAFTYILSAFLLLGWLYVRRPSVYPWARTSFLLLNLIGIACFAAYPVTPPRLLPNLGFIDTVTRGHTFGSWGSGAVDHANALAAMPSLHLAWALWVSVVLGYLASNLWVQAVSFVHVSVTLFVIVATANHYLLDAVGGALCVMLGVVLAGLFSHRPPRPTSSRVAAADAFFLYVENSAAPQHVGGLMILEVGPDRPLAPNRDELEMLVRHHLDELPRFTQRLAPTRAWRRPRWEQVAELDWAWHVCSRDLHTAQGQPGGMAALDAFMAELQSTPLPRDRPLWRLITLHGVTDHESAAVLVMHHVIADGLGTVQHAVRLLEPAFLPPPPSGPEPGRLRRVSARAIGLAQLARDGKPAWRPIGVDGPGRVFGTANFPFDEVRRLARAFDVRVTDLVLCLMAGGLSRGRAPDLTAHGGDVRVSVTLPVPRSGTAEGNATGAAMVDVPLDRRPERERLAEIARRSGRVSSGTRAMASRFVMDTGGELLPPVLHAWFARTVYGRRHFHAIVSNMPGPPMALTLAGYPLARVYPILPLAPGSPIAVGALSVSGRLGVSISAHPAFVPDGGLLGRAMTEVYDELLHAAGLATSPDPGPSDHTLSGPRREPA